MSGKIWKLTNSQLSLFLSFPLCFTRSYCLRKNVGISACLPRFFPEATFWAAYGLQLALSPQLLWKSAHNMLPVIISFLCSVPAHCFAWVVPDVQPSCGLGEGDCSDPFVHLHSFSMIMNFTARELIEFHEFINLYGLKGLSLLFPDLHHKNKYFLVQRLFDLQRPHDTRRSKCYSYFTSFRFHQTIYFYV